MPHLPPITLPRVFLLLSLLAAAWPAGAAAEVKLVTRDVPLAPASGRGAAHVVGREAAPTRFNMVGIHWRGAGSVEFRTAARRGAWSAWRRARPEPEDGPDGGSAEASRTRGWKVGNPWWTGPAERIEYRTAGRVTRLRVHFLWSEEEAEAVRAPARASAPTVIRRHAWGANESIVRGTPSYADRLAFAVIHHTAGASPSTPSESAAIVRGIQAYHVLSNKWDDIGYNFLVDRFGQVFEGRGGGITRNVVGAHAMGFNTGSVGVAVLGSYGSSGISKAARNALRNLLAWRLDVGHVDPLARVRRVSGGSPRFPAGQTVTLNAIGGHRDTGLTSCPGALLYDQLGALRRAVAARGLPKLYDPAVSGSLGGLVRFTARLSTSREWRVTVTNGDGARVARGTGTGTVVDWTWNSTAITPGSYFYAIRAGAGIRPARGLVATRPPLAVEGVAASPKVVTPNGDGVTDQTTIGFTLSVAAQVRVTLRDNEGATTATLVDGRWLGAGPTAITFAGTRTDGTTVPDGRYDLVVEASTATEAATATRSLTVDRTLAAVSATPRVFSPNGDGVRDTTAIAWTLARDADVRVRVRGAGTTATVFDGTLPAGGRTFLWDGAAAGALLTDGTYDAVVLATTELGTRRLGTEVRLDTTPPALSRLRAVARDGGTLVRFTLDERARVTLAFGERSERVWRSAGAWKLWRADDVDRVGLVARDRAGNVAPERLVRVRRPT